ncbi:hypothetical protein B0H13DRAFT_2352153 [Mycena leptocephala]|nr:hypothetical protein B0H13DRAFT_2352153 [Mycena leptocephala]
MPVHAAQSDNMSTVATAPAAAPEPSMPEFNSSEPATNPAFDILADFDFGLLMGTSSVEGPNAASDGFNALIPSNSGTPTADPLEEFMNLYGFPGVFSDLSTNSDFSAFTSVGPSDPLPLPSPPPPESPSPAVEESSEPGPSVPKLRRSRQVVDEANILYSTRSRAPTARMRFADEDVSNRPQKKGKGKQGAVASAS